MNKERLIEFSIYRKRRRKSRQIGKRRIVSRFDIDYNIRLKSISDLNRLIKIFSEKEFIKDKYVSKHILVPSVFSFKENFDESILFFKKILSSFLKSPKAIIIDFSLCEHACISCFTLLDLIYKEYRSVVVVYNKNFPQPIYPKIEIVPSKIEKIAKYLHIFGLYEIDVTSIGIKDEYALLGLQKGKLRHYKENRKSVVATNIVNFLNKCISAKMPYEFSPRGIRAIGNLVNEVLGNAEDHTLKGSEWYVNAVSFFESQHSKQILEFNLSILNLGDSMYECFEATKISNKKMYEKVQTLYDDHSELFTRRKSFDKESLFSFYLLKEGISRLKFEEPSRGNGTMKFINAFITLGAMAEEEGKFMSDLNIISGHTILSFSNTYKPFIKDNLWQISLNKENNVSLLPDEKCLIYNQGYFPGTFLECKIYFNKDFFFKKINNAK